MSRMTNMTASPSVEARSAYSRILFGSCNSQHHPQVLWPAMRARNATAFVWGGDSVYADDRLDRWEWFHNSDRLLPHRVGRDASIDYLRELYARQVAEPGYAALRQEDGVSVFGTLDDHDFGINNGDRTFPLSRESGKEFVESLLQLDPGESALARRAIQGKGVYGVHVYDFTRPLTERLLSDTEAGLDPDVVSDEEFESRESERSENNRLVAVFVIDVRTNKVPWPRNDQEKDRVNVDGDFLGEEQWKWLTTAMKRSNAQSNIVVTGLQVHARRFEALVEQGNVLEDWDKFPGAQHRLYQVLLQPNVRAPLIISGDVHFSQMMRKDCVRAGTEVRPLVEITTSGMTHSWGGPSVCGRIDWNPMCHLQYFASLVKFVIHVGHAINPWTELLISEQIDSSDAENPDLPSRRSPHMQYLLSLNFAELDFDWDERRLTATVRDAEVNGRPKLHHTWHLDELTGTRTTRQPSLVTSADVTIKVNELQNKTIVSGAGTDDWICVNYRGTGNSLQSKISTYLTFSLLAFAGLFPFILILVGLLWLCVRGQRRQSKIKIQ